MSFPYTVPLTPKEVRTATSTQRAPLGTRGQTADGRIFRYAKAGSTALVKGLLVQAEAAATQWENTTFSALSTAFLTEVGATTIPAGTTYLHLTATGDSNMSVAKDYFKEGWVWVSGTATCGGQMMKISTHLAASSGSTGYSATGGQLYIQFEDGYALSEAIDTAAEVSVQKNLYDDVIVAATAPTAAVLGVPPCDVTGGYYFWLQTWGICAIKSEAEVIFGTNKYVTNSSQTAGCIAGATNCTGWISRGVYESNQIIIGVGACSTAIAVLQTSTFPLVHLTLSP